MNFSSPDTLAKIRNRDHKTLEVLINKYQEPLIKFALKQNLGMDQAIEVVQQTWSIFFEKIENFEGRSHIRTYLIGILFNKIKETWRSNKKYTTESLDVESNEFFNDSGNYIKPPQSPESWVESKELLHIISGQLDKLPENQRLAFTLKEIDGESTQSICNILGITSTNLGVLLYRAKNTLRLKVEESLNKDENL